MKPTPRTDEEVELINEDRLSDLDAYLTMMKHARQLERELADATQSLAFQMQLNREVIEREKQTFAALYQERQDRKQADLDTIRAPGERNDARAELAAYLLNKPKPTEP